MYYYQQALKNNGRRFVNNDLIVASHQSSKNRKRRGGHRRSLSMNSSIPSQPRKTSAFTSPPPAHVISIRAFDESYSSSDGSWEDCSLDSSHSSLNPAQECSPVSYIESSGEDERECEGEQSWQETSSVYKKRCEWQVKSSPSITQRLHVGSMRAKAVEGHLFELLECADMENTQEASLAARLAACRESPHATHTLNQELQIESSLLVSQMKKEAILKQALGLIVSNDQDDQGFTQSFRNKFPIVPANLTISGIVIDTKGFCDLSCNHHYLCTVCNQDSYITSTEVCTLSGMPKDGRNKKISFFRTLQVDKQPAHFQVFLDVYHMTSKLSAEEKSPSSSPLAKLFGRRKLKFPFSSKEATTSGKQKSKTSIAGNHGNSRFKLVGKVQFTKEDIDKDGLVILPLSQGSLKGMLQLNVLMEPHWNMTVIKSGFLTLLSSMIWERLWCQLTGSSLSLWKYPEDVHLGKEPHKYFNLCNCVMFTKPTTSSECIRKNGILLKIDQCRLVFTADSKTERDEWINDMNTVIYSVSYWKNNKPFMY